MFESTVVVAASAGVGRLTGVIDRILNLVEIPWDVRVTEVHELPGQPRVRGEQRHLLCNVALHLPHAVVAAEKPAPPNDERRTTNTGGKDR